VKLLLASAGITNASIQAAVVDLLGKPIADATALCVPTASYGMRGGGAVAAWRFISGQEPDCPMTELGWKSVGVLELTALPSIDTERWVREVRQTDVLLVNGGDPLYLCHWSHSPGTPFSWWLPRSTNSIAEPTTRSFTRLREHPRYVSPNTASSALQPLARGIRYVRTSWATDEFPAGGWSCLRNVLQGVTT
jgi:hypothetical protein